MMSSNGHGSGSRNPKWQSHIDRWVREVLETLGEKIGAMRLNETEKDTAQVAMARALIYAGATVAYSKTGESLLETKEVVDDILQTFFSDLENEDEE